MLGSQAALELAVDKTTTICCATAVDAIGADDSNAVFKTLDTLVPNVETTLQAISAKKTDLKENELATGYITDVLPVLSDKVDKLKKCLVDRAPKEKVAEATAYDTRITDAFKAAKAVYPETGSSTGNAPPASADTKPSTEVMSGPAPAAAGADTKSAPEGMSGSATGSTPPQ